MNKEIAVAAFNDERFDEADKGDDVGVCVTSALATVVADVVPVAVAVVAPALDTVDKVTVVSTLHVPSGSSMGMILRTLDVSGSATYGNMNASEHSPYASA